ncbi:MAG: glutaminyl-peptide cyclotransferase [Gemmatimonadota bacterium]|nr:glutaminyl-peptide cyclotransferase [Gemmatimonadota bacterium]
MRRHPQTGFGDGVGRLRRRRWGCIPLVLQLAGGCAGGDVTEYEIEVLRALPHDSTAYTQGLVFHDRHFFESTGRYGESTLRRVDMTTGSVLESRALDENLFGEGLARVGDSLVQLTWKEGTAIVYSIPGLDSIGAFEYEGEGWGLCHDGSALYMSDGSATLTVRDPETFQVTGTIPVTRNGFSARDLNELECVGDHIWANVYMTDRIVQIDKRSGHVVGEVDAYALSLASERPADAGAVLNGIAYDAATETFYLTGKLWSAMYEVRFLP